MFLEDFHWSFPSRTVLLRGAFGGQHWIIQIRGERWHWKGLRLVRNQGCRRHQPNRFLHRRQWRLQVIQFYEATNLHFTKPLTFTFVSSSHRNQSEHHNKRTGHWIAEPIVHRSAVQPTASLRDHEKPTKRGRSQRPAARAIGTGRVACSAAGQEPR